MASRLADQSGTASVEFVIVFPLMMTLMLGGIETGLTLTKKVMLERALDMTVRDIRLGRLTGATPDELRQHLCDRTIILTNCATDLLIETVPVTAGTWSAPTDAMSCVNRVDEITPVTAQRSGGTLVPTVVRACLIIDPVFPTTPMGLRLPLDASGGFALYSTSLYLAEP
ncbi:TadE/TadG family type IV pilus assembly protein [Roseicitreum antarcticum]|uniref:TadE/TadG family type IV pilus assembly protein n=1 Tax=Roseicitreum antarcticum TaxID=564137 RepID=UPI0016814137|nr:TadE/TadG family type IV pilus assembly protein [Roseicitreum antarcticum]